MRCVFAWCEFPFIEGVLHVHGGCALMGGHVASWEVLPSGRCQICGRTGGLMVSVLDYCMYM